MKDTRELRLFLANQMKEAADGNFDADRAKAVGNLAQQIYNTLNIELKMTLAKDKLEGQVVAPVPFGD